MIIYNTTFHIDDEIHDKCLSYLKEEYIPLVVANGILSNPRLAMIHAQYEEDGTSYSLQFNTESLDSLELWFEQVGQELRTNMASRFGSKACGFMTLLEEIEL